MVLRSHQPGGLQDDLCPSSGQALPLVGRFAPEHEAEVPLGKALLAAARPLLLEARGSDLLLEAGYLDGGWLAELRAVGLRVCSKVRQDRNR